MKIQIQISDFYHFPLFTNVITLKKYLEKLFNDKEKRNVTVNSQTEICSVTKAAQAFVLVTDTYKQLTKHIKLLLLSITLISKKEKKEKNISNAQ